jgi:hypothetical protein
MVSALVFYYMRISDINNEFPIGVLAYLSGLTYEKLQEKEYDINELRGADHSLSGSK